MKRFVVTLVACCVIVPLFLVYISHGHDPRLEVSKKKALDRLDNLLGKMDVQRQEIDDGIKATKQAVEGIRRARIKAQVKCDQLDEKAKPFEEKIAHCDQTLFKLRDLLKADMPAEIAGKTYAVTDLKDMANKIIQARKDAEAQMDTFRNARDTMKNVVTDLGKQQHALDHRLTNLQAQVAKLDAEIAAAKAMTALGQTANLDRLEEKIARLSVDVRAELKIESNADDLDSFIWDTDTFAEIDRILSPKKK